MSRLSPITRARRLWLSLAFALFSAHAAHAATQTFVSAKGDDSKPCEQEKPCRTFAGALLKTDVGGEIVALDAGEYGPVNIAHSLKITAVGVYAGITVNGPNAVNISPSTDSVVVLRGLTLTGRGDSEAIVYKGPGPTRAGTDPDPGLSLHVEGCTLSGFMYAAIRFEGSGEIFVKDTTVRNTLNTGISLYAAPGEALRATVANCRLEKNGGGLSAAGQGFVDVTVSDTVAAGNNNDGFGAHHANTRMRLLRCVITQWKKQHTAGVRAEAGAVVTLDGCMLSDLKWGIMAHGPSVVFLSNTTIADGEVGGYAQDVYSLAYIYSFGNNRIHGNFENLKGNPIIPVPQL